MVVFAPVSFIYLDLQILRIVYFLVLHCSDIIKIKFFLLHLLTTTGPPNRLVPVNSCAPRAVPSAFFGV